MKTVLTAVMMVSCLALAEGSPAAGKGPMKGEGRGEERAQRMEEHGRRMHMMAVVGIAEALDLNEADALKLAEKLKGFEEKRRPVREAMGESMKALRAAAEGEAAAVAQVDQNIARVLDGRAQMAALDKEMFTALSQGQTPQKKAKLALFMARFVQEMSQRAGHRFEGGRPDER